MGIDSLDQFNALFRQQDVHQIVIKPLSEKQDNTKNQIFIATKGAFNLFPCEPRAGLISESTKKRKSASGEAKLEASLDWSWLQPEGEPIAAKNTKLIDYFQYPEVRLSGFFKGTKYTHRALRRDSQLEYGKRYIAMGFNREGKVFGLLLTEKEDAFAREFDFSQLDSLPGFNVLLDYTPRYIRTNLVVARSNEEMLRDALAAIVERDHKGVRLTDKGLVTFKGNQVSGYTLEALLGVVSNAKKEPDAYGHEMKAFSGGRVSLCTPTADLGFEGINGFRPFMNKYGVPGKDGNSVRYTGVHKCGQATKRNFVLDLHNVDGDGFPTAKPEDIVLTITDRASGDVISGWSFQKLLESWTTKHAFACYVPAKQTKVSDGSYVVRFSPMVYMCRGTDVFKLLAAIKRRIVYFDPGHSIYNSTSEVKVRPQFRINTSRKFAALSALYDSVTLTKVLP